MRTVAFGNLVRLFNKMAALVPYKKKGQQQRECQKKGCKWLRLIRPNFLFKIINSLSNKFPGSNF